MPTAYLPSTGPTCLATVTCEPSLPLTEIGQSISSAAASHAKTSALQARGQDSPARGLVFGTSLLGSFAQYGPDGWSSKTSQLSLLGGLEPFSETWPRSGLMRNGIAYRLQQLVPRTAATESGLWPTPSASGMPCEGTVRLCRQAWLSGAATLVEANAIAGRDVRKAQGKVRPWLPTPTAMGHHTGGRMNEWGGSSARSQVHLLVEAGLLQKKEVNGSLNPTWVEWLMGFPLGWTDLGDSATPSSRRSSKSSAGRSSKRKPK